MESAKEDVRSANEAFYLAFRERDSDRMDTVWAEESDTICIHPGWGALHGRSAIMESWQRILANPGSPQIECSDVQVSVFGESAIVICNEAVAGQAPALIATNVFVREPNGWRMVHHHAGPVAPAPVPREPKRKPPDHTLN